MTLYVAKGLTNAELLEYRGELEPFDFIATRALKVVPKGADIGQYKKNEALYCLVGKVKSNKDGSYKRNDDSLIYRDLIFLDYDDIDPRADFPKIVSEALNEYSYIIYPTIKHTTEKPRYRLVVKPSNVLNKEAYEAVVFEIADTIGLPFDKTSKTWSQLQGLPVTTGNPQDYEMIVNRGKPYPVSKNTTASPQRDYSYGYSPNKGKVSATMRVVDTLLNGFGDEGGRNVALASFVGVLLSPYVGYNASEAYKLVNIANEHTSNPLPQTEVDRTFKSIATKEANRRSF